LPGKKNIVSNWARGLLTKKATSLARGREKGEREREIESAKGEGRRIDTTHRNNKYIDLKGNKQNRRILDRMR
jgi:hypothetical protein